MHVLVLGAGGLLGSNVITEALQRGASVTGTYHSTRPAIDAPLEQLDIQDTDTFRTLLDRHDPTVVVNCAAMTDVDECEQHPERAREVNGAAPGRLADVCSDTDLPFVQVSTDYVFDGTSDALYDETAPTDPIQIYGASKLSGETAVRGAHERVLVPRLSFVWGVHRATGELTGFPAWVRERLVAGRSTPLFTDQHVTPSRAGTAAATILDLVETTQTGTFHVASRRCVTPYDFGMELCERLGADDALVEAGRQADVDRPAARPENTCLDVTRVETALDRRLPTLEEDLDAVASLL